MARRDDVPKGSRDGIKSWEVSLEKGIQTREAGMGQVAEPMGWP